MYTWIKIFICAILSVPILVIIVYFLYSVFETAREKRMRDENIKNFVPPKGCRNGKLVGYKKLVEAGWHKFLSPQRADFVWYFGKWVYSDRIPSPNNTNGIYITKEGMGNILETYRGVLVKVETDGWYVEHEYGYRVHKARVIEILE